MVVKRLAVSDISGLQKFESDDVVLEKKKWETSVSKRGAGLPIEQFSLPSLLKAISEDGHPTPRSRAQVFPSKRAEGVESTRVYTFGADRSAGVSACPVICNDGVGGSSPSCGASYFKHLAEIADPRKTHVSALCGQIDYRTVTTAAALSLPVSRQWKGYWQRSEASNHTRGA
jgi:hypothetical protein